MYIPIPELSFEQWLQAVMIAALIGIILMVNLLAPIMLGYDKQSKFQHSRRYWKRI